MTIPALPYYQHRSRFVLKSTDHLRIIGQKIWYSSFGTELQVQVMKLACYIYIYCTWIFISVDDCILQYDALILIPQILIWDTSHLLIMCSFLTRVLDCANSSFFKVTFTGNASGLLCTVCGLEPYVVHTVLYFVVKNTTFCFLCGS